MINIELYNHIVEEVPIVFKDILETHEGVYVIGLYHLGGFHGLFAIFNTYSSLPPKPPLDANDEVRADYFDARWGPSNFPMLEDYTDRMPKSEHALSKMADLDTFGDDHEQRWYCALNTMQAALKSFTFDHDLKVKREVPTLYLSTYDESWGDVISRVKEINPQEVTNRVLPELIALQSRELEWKKYLYQ